MKNKLLARYLFYSLNIILPLFFGLFLYLNLRADSYVSVLLNIFIPFPVLSFSVFPEWFVSFLRNYVSDVLWAYSLGCAISLVLGYSRKKILYVILLCSGFVSILEILQKTGIFHGTFDFFDILLEICAVCMALIIIFIFEEAQNEKSDQDS